MTKSCEEKNLILDGGSVGSLRPSQRGHFAGRGRPSSFPYDPLEWGFKSPPQQSFHRALDDPDSSEALSFSGLLEVSEPRRAVSLSGVSCFKAKEGDPQCELYHPEAAWISNSWPQRTASRKSSDSSKKATLFAPLNSALKTSLCGIIWSLCLTMSVTAFCSTTTEPTAVSSNSRSTDIDVQKLATAIKLAENSKTKPYGIMRDYCHEKAEARCRKGCIQTINKRLKLWESEGRPGNFIEYLSKTYAPTKGNLRPAEKRLNPNWSKNVSHFYQKELSRV